MDVELRFFDLYSDWSDVRTEKGRVLLPNQSTEIMEIECLFPKHGQVNKSVQVSGTVVVSVRLLEVTSGNVLARYVDWPEPYRFISPPDPKMQVLISETGTPGTKIIKLEVEKPVKCVFLSTLDDVDEQGFSCITWSDNALDMVPGDPQWITVRGLKDQKIAVRYLGGLVDSV